MVLAAYRKKRDFHRTPEPPGKPGSPVTGSMFVVQRHAARRLHYDFRLELDGVLKSWAVPKGPSLDPAVKSLAVEVEDHPLEYGGFEGVIPPGQYGGGTVMLFDHGRWQPLDDAQKGLRSGKLKFRLQGQRLGGEWVLVRSSRQHGRQTEWLLIKRQDDQARPDREHQYVRQFAHSVETGRSMEQIAAAADRVWSDGQAEQERQPASEPDRSDVETPAADGQPADLPGARRRQIPEFVQPQLPTLVDHPPAGDGWLHELKLDGYRLIAVKSDHDVRLLTRGGNEWADRSPAVAEAIGHLSARRLVLDGEAVVVGPDGTTDFQALQNSLSQGRFEDHVYFAFDLLYCDGYDLTQCPLEARKQFLQTLLADCGGDAQTLRFSDHVRGQGDAMFRQACRYAVEGVVSKRADGRYVSGRSRQWLKSKCLLRQEFVVVGLTPPQGSRLHFGALLLGYYDAQQRLVYCGRVGTGFTAESLAEVSEKLRQRRIAQPPVEAVPAGAAIRDVTWVRPELVVEVKFAQWTNEGVLRHGSFQGLREDKDPAEVGRELPEGDRKQGTPAPARSRSAGAVASSGSTASLDGSKPSPRRPANGRPDRGGVRVAGVLISHPQKILYPEQNLAKADLAVYYERVAEWILPHIADRPLSLVRCPEGHSHECFYQKYVAESMPETIHSVEVQQKSGSKRYVMIDDLPGLVALVQLGVLEIHPWGSRKDQIDRPDRLVIDLDPGPGVAWPAVVEAAHLVRVILQKVDLESFVRTSGGKGLHVVVPLVRRHDWSEAKQFAGTLAQRLARRWPDHFVATSAHAKRTGKIYVDYLRNARGATAIASYSTRARPGATVATPLDWDELTTELHPEDYHVGTVPERLAALLGDPWAGLSGLRQSLTARRRSAVAR